VSRRLEVERPGRQPAADDQGDVEAAAVGSWFPALGLVFAVAGVGASSYLTAAHYTTTSILACSGSGAINCAKVTTSARSMLIGIPVAVLGLAWFLAMVILNLPSAWRSASPPVTVARLVFAITGMGFALYLIGAELLSIKAICLWCTAVHVLTFALFVLTLAGTSRLGLAATPRGVHR
jgi:uncharacterized membrane protein